MEIVDNFLSRDVFLKIQNTIMDKNFPWYYCPTVAYKEVEDSYYYFVHNFFLEEKITSYLGEELITPIIEQLKIKSLIRARANLYTKLFHQAEDGNHQDYDFTHKGAILYLNTTDGPTIINNETKIDSIENRCLIFDPSIIHRSTHPNNTKARFNIIINYF